MRFELQYKVCGAYQVDYGLRLENACTAQRENGELRIRLYLIKEKNTIQVVPMCSLTLGDLNSQKETLNHTASLLKNGMVMAHVVSTCPVYLPCNFSGFL